MKFFIACFTFVVFLESAIAQKYSAGACPQVKLQERFDLKTILGKWYKHSSYEPLGGSQLCYVTYSDLKGDTLTYTTTQINNKALESVATPIKYIGGAKLELQFSGVKSVDNILATDYGSYLIVYSCRNLGDTHGTFITIFTRKPNPSNGVVREARTKIAERQLPLEPLTSTRSKDCKV